MKGPHREGILFAFPEGELLFKVVKRVELVRGVEVFVALTMAALHLAVMPGSIRFDQFVANAEHG